MYIDSQEYVNDIDNVVNSILSIGFPRKIKILFIGASGLIGTFFCDVIMRLNSIGAFDCELYALCRDRKKAEARFAYYHENQRFHLIYGDINYEEDVVNIDTAFDVVIDAASNTHPKQYRTRPIETIMSNVNGLYNILNGIRVSDNARYIYCSSVEIYGDCQGKYGAFDESFSGYINCNTLRAGYPESKRVGEALCQAFIEERGKDIVIVRFSRVYGPTMRMEDSRAISQFVASAVNNEKITIKSDGHQFYSYIYVADAVSSLFYLIKYGKKGCAYNVSGKKSDISLNGLASILSQVANVDVKHDKPSIIEQRGYSVSSYAVLDTSLIEKMGWRSMYGINDGLSRTISELKRVKGKNT